MPAREFGHAEHVGSVAQHDGNHARIAVRQRLLKEQGQLGIVMQVVRCAEEERQQMRPW